MHFHAGLPTAFTYLEFEAVKVATIGAESILVFAFSKVPSSAPGTSQARELRNNVWHIGSETGAFGNHLTRFPDII